MIFMNDCKSAKQAKDYFEHLQRSDYYMKDGQELKGLWFGHGAALLGLKGEVKREDFFKLCDNINPLTGKQLTPRTKIQRRVMTDVTFNAPKDVSLAYAFGDDRILEGFQDAVGRTMQWMEAEAATRVRKDGANELERTGNLIGSGHLHKTTRPHNGKPEPHLHVHVILQNATFSFAENRMKAVDISRLFKDKGLYQAMFLSYLAENMRALGYGITRQGNSFGLVGFSRELVEKFSNRTLLIERQARRLGITDPLIKGELGRRTREKKPRRRFPCRSW